MLQGRGCTRRNLLKWSVISGVAAAIAPWVRGAEIGEDSFNFHRQIPSPVKIQSIDVLKTPRGHYLRVRSADGGEGLAITNDRLPDLLSLLKRRIIPHFIGQDARDIQSLLESVYTVQSNYKYAGLAFWCCVGFVEFALMDLMGKIAGKSVGQMLGGVVRKQVPVYMSSMRRDTSPAQEVD